MSKITKEEAEIRARNIGNNIEFISWNGPSNPAKAKCLDCGREFEYKVGEKIYRLKPSGEPNKKCECRYIRNINTYNEDESYINKSNYTEKGYITHIHNYIKNQGYNYTYNQLSNLYLSLKTKPFTILAGISGTGKSKIIRLLADSINADYTLISVRPDWNDATEILGYKNLDDKFIKGQLTKTILKAKQNKNRLCFK